MNLFPLFKQNERSPRPASLFGPEEEAILPAAGSPPSPAHAPPDGSAGRIIRVPICEICPNRAQPRREFEPAALAGLADSIRQFGILQPLTVRPISPGGGRWELIAGERRLRAAQMIGLSTVPCLLLRVDDREAAELALVENLQREDLNLFEQAAAIASLIDLYHLTQEEAAHRLSASQSYIANKLRLLRLTQPERTLLLEAGLTERHARALLRIPDPVQRLQAMRHIIDCGMTVAAAESYVEGLLSDRTARQAPRRRLVLRDVRLFYHTIDRAVALMREAGIDAESARREVGDGVEVLIRIPRVYQ